MNYEEIITSAEGGSEKTRNEDDEKKRQDLILLDKNLFHSDQLQVRKNTDVKRRRQLILKAKRCLINGEMMERRKAAIKMRKEDGFQRRVHSARKNTSKKYHYVAKLGSTKSKECTPCSKWHMAIGRMKLQGERIQNILAYDLHDRLLRTWMYTSFDIQYIHIENTVKIL